MTKSNLEKGIPWRFGIDWPGQRCGAKTRRGTACQKPPLAGKKRCRLHGGLSTGPKTPEGKARIAASHWKHGRRSKKFVQMRKKIWRESYAQLRRGCALTGLFRELNLICGADVTPNRLMTLEPMKAPRAANTDPWSEDLVAP